MGLLEMALYIYIYGWVTGVIAPINGVGCVKAVCFWWIFWVPVAECQKKTNELGPMAIRDWMLMCCSYLYWEIQRKLDMLHTELAFCQLRIKLSKNNKSGHKVGPLPVISNNILLTSSWRLFWKPMPWKNHPQQLIYHKNCSTNHVR